MPEEAAGRGDGQQRNLRTAPRASRQLSRYVHTGLRTSPVGGQDAVCGITMTGESFALCAISVQEFRLDQQEPTPTLGGGDILSPYG